MRSKLTIGQFYEKYQQALQLRFLSQQVGFDSEIQLSTSAAESFEAVDYLNVIRPSSVAIIGHQESKYINSLRLERQIKLFTKLFSGVVVTLLLSEKAKLKKEIIELAEQNSVPLFISQFEDSDLYDHCRYLLTRELAEHICEHGVFIEVYSLGIFISGESGIGKSELALALITRGHRLIADDVTQFSRTLPDTLDGHSPGFLADFMEVRGLGVVNIKAMFGSNAIKRNKTLRFIIHLTKYTEENKHQFDRLGTEQKSKKILGIEVPQIDLPVAPGRNIAALVEAAARNHLLCMNGYNAAEDFIQKQRQAIRNNSE